MPTTLLESRGLPLSVSLPTCGLALAESERAFPPLIGYAETALAEAGIPGEEIIIRTSGCPNGCSRPYVAEIGLVGKAPGKYQLYLGGNATGTRLNRVYKDVIKADELPGEFRALFTRFAQEREAGERFGDWANRILFS